MSLQRSSSMRCAARSPSGRVLLTCRACLRSLQGNGIEDEGARHVGDALAVNCTLQALMYVGVPPRRWTFLIKPCCTPLNCIGTRAAWMTMASRPMESLESRRHCGAMWD